MPNQTIKYFLLSVLILMSGFLAEGCRNGTHGMTVIFSTDSVFFSHVPMYHYPHDFQFLFSTNLKVNSTIIPNTLYTFEPEILCLNDLLSGDKTSFKGDLYQGNFEDGGVIINSDVVVNITKIIYTNKLDNKNLTSENPLYVVFNSNVTNGSANLLHIIEGETNFDHILKANIEDYKNMTYDGQILSILGIENDISVRLHHYYNYTAFDVNNFSAPLIKISSVVEYRCLLGPDFSDDCGNKTELMFLH